jgi:hypothetical protein
VTAQTDSEHISDSSPEESPGPFLAKVINYLDSTYMGMLEVELLRPGGATGGTGQFRNVSYLSPFLGQTGVDYIVPENSYNGTQKSYGFWMVPPDVGTTVIVFFINGNPKYGYWIGCVQDENMNFMLPGLASTENTVETGQQTDMDGRKGRVPVAEYNKAIQANNTSKDSSQIEKPVHPFKDILDNQGLLLDDTRGITTSSARRDLPSAVYGISTPGPVDKQGGAPQGPVGKVDNQIPNAYVSRLGGTQIIMDDGDDKFLRKLSPSEGPPEYASVEQDETDGDVTRPHNELVRIRTRTGHQILLHNSEDLIYISNSRGTSWIELSSDGKIDIYAQDSISVHTGADLNFFADRDINFEAGRNINIKATERYQSESGTDYNVVVGGDGKITVAGKFDLNSGGTNKFTSG